jgi:hypothetical protein
VGWWRAGDDVGGGPEPVFLSATDPPGSNDGGWTKIGVGMPKAEAGAGGFADVEDVAPEPGRGGWEQT